MLQHASAQVVTALESIDKLGWEATNVSMPEKLTDADIGEVTYLLTLNKKGKVKNINALKNTFTRETEKRWRETVRDIKFSRATETEGVKPQYRGTFFISRERCNKPPFELSLGSEQ